MNDIEELTDRLKKLPDTYEDVVLAVPRIAKKYGFVKELTEMIDANKDTITDDVLDYVYELKQKKLQNEAEQTTE